jgi:hypothetical protein
MRALNPVGYLERVDKLLGQGVATGGAQLNVGQMFLQAVMQADATPQPQGRVIEHDSSGVLPGCDDW